MEVEEITAIIDAEIAGDQLQSNSHGIDLHKCLVFPRIVSCRNTFPNLNGGNPLSLWIVLEEEPGEKDGYLIVFDERLRQFGLAIWDGDTATFLGYHGTFLDSLNGM